MHLIKTRATSPFDDSAAERRRRMGLLLADGKPNREAMAALSRVFAGLFFDELCDIYQDYESVVAMLERLQETAESVAEKEKFLLICLQYDGLGRQLPDPVWWISGNPELADLFSSGFLTHLRQLSEEKNEGAYP